MTSNKTQQTNQPVRDFIATVPDPLRRADAEELLELITKVTGVVPVMWGPSIIGFGSYHYTYESGREGDSPVVGFSPRKPALVLYGILLYDTIQGNKALAEQLGPHKAGKGCVYIKKLAEIDKEVLTKMIKGAFKARSSATKNAT